MVVEDKGGGCRGRWWWLSSFRQYSFRVIPGTIPAEFEFHSKFRWNRLINLAGPWAKIDSIGIPGIAWILPDSGRNQWRTIKTSWITTFPTNVVSGMMIDIVVTIHNKSGGVFPDIIPEAIGNGSSKY